jgi:RimJ/RimL family protein N-acetyltransferase
LRRLKGGTLNIELLSEKYLVRRITEADVSEVVALCKGNPLYYEHCPPFVTQESVNRDRVALPVGKTKEDKYYLGFFKDESLIAVMDLITGYPDSEVAFIGFFMMDQRWQGKNIGTEIITEVCQYLKEVGFIRVSLGYAKGNAQSEVFWLKNHFEKTGLEKQAEGYISVYMQRWL